MSIQSNINQIISVAGVLAGMNPQVKALGEKTTQLRDLKKRESVLAKQYDVAKYDLNKQEQIEADLTGITEERFNVSPTAKNYEEVLRSTYQAPSALSEESVAENRQLSAQLQKEKEAREALEIEQERLRKSKEFASMFTEGVYSAQSDPRAEARAEREHKRKESMLGKEEF